MSRQGGIGGTARSAVKAIAAPTHASQTAYVDTMLGKTVDLEQRLSACAKQQQQSKPSSTGTATHHKQINQYRMMLCECLSDWILCDPTSASVHDCVGRLWRGCFYARIGPARQKLQKDRKKHATHTVAAVHAQQESLTIFLTEGITLYEYLCDKLQSKLKDQHGTTSEDDSTMASTSERDTQDTTTTTPIDLSGVLPCLHRLYIHLGDLFRYGNSSAHSRKADQAYQVAAGLCPGSGHAFNQRAVVCQVKDDKAVSVYWYARSLGASVEPFGTAKSNLKRLFGSNQEWLLVQQQKQQQANGGVAAASVLGTASKLFLARFVEIQCTLQQRAVTSPGSSSSSSKNTGRDEDYDIPDSFYNLLGESVASFRDLLASSAFGDALLCKLVSVLAYSEYSCRQNNKVKAALAARMAVLEFGQCLGERVGTIVGNKKKAAAKNSVSAAPSVRVLMAFLLVTEYVLGTLESREMVSEANDERYTEAVEAFGRVTVDVWNLLHTLDNSTTPSTDDPFAKPLKEYQMLRGFAPFSSFLKDDTVLETGYLSMGAALEFLESVSKEVASHGGGSQSQATAGSNLSSMATQESGIKIQRFVALRRQLLGVPGIEQKVDGTLEWVASATQMDEDDDDGGDDIMHLSDPVQESKGNGPGGEGVLMYNKCSAGGPELLVPGALLQSLSGEKTLDNAVAQSPSYSLNPVQAKVMQQIQNAPSERVANEHTPLQIGIPVLPPPGFGQQQPSYNQPQSLFHQASPSMAQGHLPPGFAPTLGFHQHSSSGAGHAQTIGESYDLFGGPSALQTANPFAVGTIPSFGGGTLVTPPSDSSFLSHSVPMDRTSLLESNFLNSMLMEDGDPSTKNPFAT